MFDELFTQVVTYVEGENTCDALVMHVRTDLVAHMGAKGEPVLTVVTINPKLKHFGGKGCHEEMFAIRHDVVHVSHAFTEDQAKQNEPIRGGRWRTRDEQMVVLRGLYLGASSELEQSLLEIKRLNNLLAEVEKQLTKEPSATALPSLEQQVPVADHHAWCAFLNSGQDCDCKTQLPIIGVIYEEYQPETYAGVEVRMVGQPAVVINQRGFDDDLVAAEKYLQGLGCEKWFNTSSLEHFRADRSMDPAERKRHLDEIAAYKQRQSEMQALAQKRAAEAEAPVKAEAEPVASSTEMPAAPGAAKGVLAQMEHDLKNAPAPTPDQPQGENGPAQQ